MFNSNKLFSVGELKIFPFSIPHDAAEPCGFNIYYSNNKISIATDLGHIDSNIISKLQNSSFILLEYNYDPDIMTDSDWDELWDVVNESEYYSWTIEEFKGTDEEWEEYGGQIY